MRVLYDTSALVAFYCTSHPVHPKIVDLHLDFINGDTEFFISVHSLAELYHTLTKGISYLNLSASQADQLIHKSVIPLFNSVPFTENDYSLVINYLRSQKLTGGIIYDGLIAKAAENAQVKSLVTLNIKDFKRVWPLTSANLVEP